MAAADAERDGAPITPGSRRPGNMSKCTDGLASKAARAGSPRARRVGLARLPERTHADDGIRAHETFTDGNFDTTVLKAATPVLVDFWAEWCGPVPRDGAGDPRAGDRLRRQGRGRQAQRRRQPGVTMKYMVRGIPTVMLFKGGPDRRSARRAGRQGHAQADGGQAHWVMTSGTSSSSVPARRD